MRTVLRLTVAKIRAHIYRSVFQSGTVATTAFTLSFLLIFSINANALRAGFKESHFTKFLSKMADALGTSLLLVGLIAAVSVFVYMRIWRENGEIFSGRLASVGANEGQLAAISFVELTVLYLVPVFVGTSLGAPVAGLVTGVDLIAQLKGKELCGELVLPSNMLRHGGDLFLCGTSREELAEKLGVSITLCENDGYEFLDKLIGNEW